MSYKRLQLVIFFGVFLGVAILSFFIFLPYLDALALGAVLAIVSHPVYEWILRALGGRKKSLAALLTTLLLLVVVLAPLLVVGIQIFQEAYRLSSVITTQEGGVEVVVGKTVEALQRGLGNFFPPDSPVFEEISANLDGYVEKFLAWLIRNFGEVFSSIVRILFGLVLSLFAFYYFLRDGEKIKNALIAVSPLEDRYDQEITEKLMLAVNSVVKGSLVVAMLQGVLVGIGFALFGVPNAMLWGLLGVVAALVPTVGTALVTLPGALYLFLSERTGGAIGLMLWGLLLVGFIDNVVRPKLIERGIHIHPFLVFLSVLGGIHVLGPIGFLLGPIVLSLLSALFVVYQEEAGRGSL